MQTHDAPYLLLQLLLLPFPHTWKKKKSFKRFSLSNAPETAGRRVPLRLTYLAAAGAPGPRPGRLSEPLLQTLDLPLELLPLVLPLHGLLLWGEGQRPGDVGRPDGHSTSPPGRKGDGVGSGEKTARSDADVQGASHTAPGLPLPTRVHGPGWGLPATGLCERSGAKRQVQGQGRQNVDTRASRAPRH